MSWGLLNTCSSILLLVLYSLNPTGVNLSLLKDFCRNTMYNVTVGYLSLLGKAFLDAEVFKMTPPSLIVLIERLCCVSAEY